MKNFGTRYQSFKHPEDLGMEYDVELMRRQAAAICKMAADCLNDYKNAAGASFNF